MTHGGERGGKGIKTGWIFVSIRHKKQTKKNGKKGGNSSPYLGKVEPTEGGKKKGKRGGNRNKKFNRYPAITRENTEKRETECLYRIF